AGNTIRVTTDFDAVNGMGRQPRVDLRLAVPPTTDVSTQVTAGGIQITGISGRFAARLVAGNLQMESVTVADGSRIHIPTGNLDFSGSVAAGASLDVSVDTGQASLELPASSAVHLDASTNLGSVEVSGWQLSTSKDNAGASAVG